MIEDVINEIRWKIEDNSLMIIAVGCILIIGMVLITASLIPNNTPVVITSNSTPTPMPSITIKYIINTPTPTPTVKPYPVPWAGESYDQYIRDLEAFYNVYETPATNRTFPDPLSYDGIQMLLSQNHTLPQNPDYIPGHPETASGYLLYTPPSPTPTPLPVVDPFANYTHLPLRDGEWLPPNNYDAVNGNESLLWNMYKTNGLEDYYHNDPGYCDTPMFRLEFLSRYLDEIKDPYVKITIEKFYLDPVTYNVTWYSVFDVPLAWYEEVTIPKPYWNYDHTVFHYSTVTIQKTLPSAMLMYLGDGTYRFHIEIYDHAQTVRLGEVTKQICIF